MKEIIIYMEKWGIAIWNYILRLVEIYQRNQARLLKEQFMGAYQAIMKQCLKCVKAIFMIIFGH